MAPREAVLAEITLHYSSSYAVAFPVVTQVPRVYPPVFGRWIYLLVDFGDLELESLAAAHFLKKLENF